MNLKNKNPNSTAATLFSCIHFIVAQDLTYVRSIYECWRTSERKNGPDWKLETYIEDLASVSAHCIIEFIKRVAVKG